MTQVVTVHTDFTDLNQMAQGLVGRVNETHVILPGPDVVDVGEWVQFAVTLYDGTPGFAGVGRCVTVVDNGEERMSHQRFDVVIDSLQFDPRGQQIFEHILTLNGVAEGAGEDTGGYAGENGYADQADDAYAGEMPVGSLEPAAMSETGNFVDVTDDFANSQPNLRPFAQAEAEREAPRDNHDDATVIGARAELEQALARASLDDEAEESEATMPPPAAHPTPVPARRGNSDRVNGSHAAPVNGVNGTSFAYANGLPFPKAPPKPQIDPTRRVTPAPRPAGSQH